MTAEATYFSDSDVIQETTPSAGYASGEVIQLADGRAGYVAAARALVSGDPAGLQTKGIVTLAKTASVVCVKGCPAYWDRSANTCTPLRALTGGDFLIGTFADDAASTDTTCLVNLNDVPRYDIDIFADPCTTVVVGSGPPTLTYQPSQANLLFTSTSEAQKLDILSNRSWPATIPFVIEGRIKVVDNGNSGAGDFNIGCADDTHASDADSIVNSLFMHIDSNALHILAESDNVTAEVAATDTTVDYAEGTPFDFVMDARNLADIQIYINGVLVLSGSTFSLSGAAGPLKLLVHQEKSSDATLFNVIVEKLAVRFMDVTT